MVPVDDICPLGLEIVPGIFTTGQISLVHLGTLSTEEAKTFPSQNRVHLVHFRTPDGSTNAARDLLTGLGWEMVEQTHLLDNVPVKSTVLVMDEMFSPVLSNLSDDQFTALRELLDRECRLLWVTMG